LKEKTMKKLITISLALALLMIVRVRAADETPQMPQPQKEHEWLKQLAGEWDLDMIMQEPGKDAVKEKGSESTACWAVLGGGRGEEQHDGHALHGLMTLGYDAKNKKYVATWVDSMEDYLWKYDGTLDDSGKILTLETGAPARCRVGR
jgi:hypothetical protein